MHDGGRTGSRPEVGGADHEMRGKESRKDVAGTKCAQAQNRLWHTQRAQKRHYLSEKCNESHRCTRHQRKMRGSSVDGR